MCASLRTQWNEALCWPRAKYWNRPISGLKTSRSPNAASSQSLLLPEGVTLEQWEQMMIREALRRSNGNKSQAARMLGLTRNALRYRLSQMGMRKRGGMQPRRDAVLQADHVRRIDALQRVSRIEDELASFHDVAIVNAAVVSDHDHAVSVCRPNLPDLETVRSIPSTRTLERRDRSK